MIVAAGARTVKASTEAGDGIDLFIHVVHLEALFKALVHIFGPEREESGCDQQAVPFRRRRGGKQVTCQLS